MSPDKRHGDQRDEPLDVPSTREGQSTDLVKGGFQNVEGPGARRGERGVSSTPGSEEARALDRGDEDLEDIDLDAGPGVDSATTGSPHAPNTGGTKSGSGR